MESTLAAGGTCESEQPAETSSSSPVANAQVDCEFDPPALSLKRKRRDEADDDAASEGRQTIHRSNCGYGDALLLASLSDDVKEAGSKDQTPRRSNLAPDRPFILHPKPVGPEKKKVTPDRIHETIKHEGAVYPPPPNTYHPHWDRRYPPPPHAQYPPYYPPAVYPPPQPYYPRSTYPPPPPPGYHRHHVREGNEDGSASPLPYHPHAHHHTTSAPAHQDEPRYGGWYGGHPPRYGYENGQHPPPYHRGEYLPEVSGKSYEATPYAPNGPDQPYTVSMDENSPRVEYGDVKGAPLAPPHTPSHPHPHAPTVQSPYHTHVEYDPYLPHPTRMYDPPRDYATPPPPEYVDPHSEGRMPSTPSRHQFRKGARSSHSDPVLLRKKFSWRNYPELEEYLIAHRNEYLRHSALNYTAEQKHFNNRLTEGLLELAAKHNYVFDESCFNFVAVRDRIRCYYKSYVQSSRKRGVVVGFPKTDRRGGEDSDSVDL